MTEWFEVVTYDGGRVTICVARIETIREIVKPPSWAPNAKTGINLIGDENAYVYATEEYATVLDLAGVNPLRVGQERHRGVTS